jgi:hypothetical protein
VDPVPDPLLFFLFPCYRNAKYVISSTDFAMELRFVMSLSSFVSVLVQYPLHIWSDSGHSVELWRCSVWFSIHPTPYGLTVAIL